MFPGQGAQFVGMCEETCKTVPAAKVSISIIIICKFNVKI